VPALRAKVKVKDDNDLLRGLPKVKMTEMTWVPWAFSRLSMDSGYGAGIVSPGFYQHQWDNPSDDGSLWLSHVAQVLRDNGNDISVAHVIEALNLAKSLAALRGISRPGLAEFDEAVTTVMGFGDDTLLSLVRKKLTIGTVYGSVPDDMTNVPLLADFYAQLKRLKISLSEQDKQLTLDLRTDLHLQRSIFFNRCQLFGLDLASREEVANAAGTFKEVWTLHYSPEIAIRMVERAAYGNTLETACNSFVSAVCLASDSDIASLADLLESVMAADLPSAVDTLTACIDSLAATSSDFVDMMKAVPHLARIVRYGTVRNQDYSSVRRMLDVLFARINAGGVKACINPEVDSVDAMFDLFSPVDYSVSILDDEDITSEWLDLLSRLSSTDEVYPLILGYSSRLLYNHHSIDTSEVSRRLSVASSVGTPPLDLALFLDGFLYGSASTLLIDDDLFDAVNSWLHSLSDEDYTYVLPVLRSSFHRFSSPERRRIGEKAKSMLSSSSLSSSSRVSSSAGSSEWNVCHDSAAAVLPLIELFFGTSPSNNSQS
jgi:hypothetical protein